MKKKLPFQDMVDSFVASGYMSKREALDAAQVRYESFKKQNKNDMRVQLEASNDNESKLISHLTTTNTVLLTASGIILASGIEEITTWHIGLFAMSVSLAVVAISLGAYAYLDMINFHTKWALAHHNIDIEVDRRLDAGKIQWNEDMRKVQDKEFDKMPTSSKTWPRKSMAALTILCLLFTISFYSAYLFDLPGSW